MKSPSKHKPSPEAWLVYDGDCPLCSAYVRRVRFKANYGELTLLDAREPHPIVTEVATSFDLDEGMVLKLGDDYYFADDCIHVLALLSETSGLFGRVNGLIFRHKALARVCYPVLRSGRNLVLALLGRNKLGLNPH